MNESQKQIKVNKEEIKKMVDLLNNYHAKT